MADTSTHKLTSNPANPEATWVSICQSGTAEHDVSNHGRKKAFWTQNLMDIWRDFLGLSEDVRHASLSKHVLKLGRSGGLLTRRLQLQAEPLYLATLVRSLPCGYVKKEAIPRLAIHLLISM